MPEIDNNQKNTSQQPQKTFAFGELLFGAWQSIKPQFWKILLIWFSLIVITLVGGILQQLDFSSFDTNSYLFLTIFTNVVAFIVNIAASISTMTLCLKLSERQTVDWNDIFQHWNLFIRWMLGSIAYGIAVLVGLIVFVIPGIMMAVRFSLWGYFLLDRNASPLQALDQSWNAVRGCSWKVFFFMIIVALINVIGFLCFGIGLLITAPLTGVAYALLYRKLSYFAS